jgi:putative ABC transport system permease protein
VDDLTLNSGHWPTQPDQIVLNNIHGPGEQIGSQITVTGVPGSPKLTVVGFATSITQTAQAWVLPAEVAALRAPGSPDLSQMLYRFASAATTAQVNADMAAVRAALPAGSVLGAQSYLSVKLRDTSSIAPWVPFIVAFGVIGLVMSALIVANVVSGAVVAGTRRIGVLKSIGFSPGQVVASYVIQVAVPASIGSVTGVAAGSLLSVPLLGQTAQVYGVGRLTVPVWVDVAVPLAMLGLAGLAAFLLAWRAGRMSAVQAIAIGRAPRPKHGYAAHRVLGRGPWARLPRSVTIGLAGPFARPARTAITLAAILFGGVAVTFGAGLGTSLNRVYADLSHTSSESVQVNIPGVPTVNQDSGVVKIGAGPHPDLPSLAVQEQTVQAALRAQPGTLHWVTEADDDVSVLGVADHVSLIGFGGDASWTGYALISGHWYQGPGQVDVNTAFLTDTGAKVGDSYTVTSGTRSITVQIAGEIFDPGGGQPELVGSQSTLAGLDPGLAPDQYDVALTPGTDALSYAASLGARLQRPYQVNVNGGSSSQFFVIIGLVATLTLLLVAVAGLGVLNTVVLQTRERVHDLGVFKAIGMTPRQTIAMVVCSVAGVGLVAGLIAIPVGIVVHNYVVPLMGHAAQTDVPPSVLSVYHPWELVLLALSGLVIAAAGALLPAGWAAQRTQVRAAGRAASRSSPIGCPHRSHRPYRPAASRPSAASTAASCSRACSSSAAVCCRSKASVAPSGVAANWVRFSNASGSVAEMLVFQAQTRSLTGCGQYLLSGQTTSETSAGSSSDRPAA